MKASRRRQLLRIREARARGYDPTCPDPGVAPPPVILRQPPDAQVPLAQGVSDSAASPDWFRIGHTYIGATDLKKTAPVAGDPATILARLEVPMGAAILVTKWAQRIVRASGGWTPAKVGPIGAFFSGTDIAVEWYLVAYHREHSSGALVTDDPRGGTPLVPESGTTEIVSPSGAPRPVNVDLPGPVTVVLACRFQAGSSIPSAHVGELGGYIEGYVYAGADKVSEDARFVGRMAATSGGG